MMQGRCRGAAVPLRLPRLQHRGRRGGGAPALPRGVRRRQADVLLLRVEQAGQCQH